MTRIFHRHPLAFPLGMIVVGGGLVALAGIGMGTSVAPGLLRVAIIGGLVLAAGVLMLPFGVTTAVRRKRHRIELVCPACGFRDRNGTLAFGIERPPDLDYVIVTCPKCSWVFEAEKYATLV